MVRKVLVAGARGMLGTDLCALLERRGWQVVAADIGEFDITDARATHAFVKDHLPSVIINCAAYTAVDQAESDREAAFLVNRDGARHLAEAAVATKASMVHLSTDYVFDGTKNGPYAEDDEPNPRNLYGESKLAGEAAVREALAEHYIVRSAWLYGIHGKSFPRTMLRLAREGRALRVVSDQKGSPTYTEHLAEALAAVIEKPLYGTYHAVDGGFCTWYELACEVFRAAGVRAEVRPITTAEYPTPARRPTNSMLDTTKLRKCYGVAMPDWRAGVAAFCEKWKREPAEA
jgi:dTDP-4-dehydrorhamnose reductase